MDKNTFKQEINDYTARGGKFAFAFDDIHLPVIYNETLNMLGGRMPKHEVFGLSFNSPWIENPIIQR